MPFRPITPEVLAATGDLPTVTWADVEALKTRAQAGDRGRARILLHGDPEALQHEMVIVMSRGQYLPPHRNDLGAKSYVVLAGAFVLVRFNDDGTLRDHRRLAIGRDGTPFMARLQHPVWHTCIPVTGQAVYLESGRGPHRRTRFADWAPGPDAGPAAAAYFEDLCQRIGLCFDTGGRTDD